MKVCEYLANFLAERGCRHVFGVPGGMAMYLNDALGHHPKLTWVSTLHEQAAAIAAEAYATTSGGIGVCCVTAGPGATNAITGCLAAWQESTPVVFISGQVKSADIGCGVPLRQCGAQQAPIIRMVGPITKYAITVHEANSLPDILHTAFYEMMFHRNGPVWIEIPLDVQNAEITTNRTIIERHPYKLDCERPWLREATAKIARKIANAARPVILVGNGVRRAKAEPLLAQLIERARIPVLTTWQGKDLIPADHPLNCGSPGSFAPRGANWAMQRADLLLIIGARMDKAIIAYDAKNLAKHAHKIMVDVDPNEIAKLGCIDEAIPVDAEEFLREILKAEWPYVSRDWIERCQAWRDDHQIVQSHHRDGIDLSMYAFAEALSDACEQTDVILPGSSGLCAEIMWAVLKSKKGQRIFSSKGTGAMGFGPPAAIGAALASGRRVVCVDGDGSFQMNVQELETIRRLNLNIKFFVINNGGYASIRTSQMKHLGRKIGADEESGMTLPKLNKVAYGYGVHGFAVREAEFLHRYVRGTLAEPGTVICEVFVRKDEVREPCVQTMIDADGKIHSGKLENMWPPIEEQVCNAT